MSLPKYFSDLAIVLKRINYGETDKIVTLFTREHGKISAIAKGVRRTTSRKAPHIEPFVLTKVYLTNGKGMPILTQAETQETFSKLKSDLEKTKDIFYLGEIIDRLTTEDEPNEDIFNHFIYTLKELEHETREQTQLITHFQIYLLQNLGFGLPPQTDTDSLNRFIEQLIDRKIKSNELS